MAAQQCLGGLTNSRPTSRSRRTVRGLQHNAKPAEDRNLPRVLNGLGSRDGLDGSPHGIRLICITSTAVCRHVRRARPRLRLGAAGEETVAYTGRVEAPLVLFANVRRLLLPLREVLPDL